MCIRDRIMGGKILKLRSEELLEQGEARGRLTGLREGRLKMCIRDRP